MADICGSDPCHIVDNFLLFDLLAWLLAVSWDADTDNCTHDVFMNVSLLETFLPILRTHGQIPLIFVKMWRHLFIYFGLTACEILVPQPGIKSMPPALAVWSLNNRTAREVPEAT